MIYIIIIYVTLFILYNVLTIDCIIIIYNYLHVYNSITCDYYNSNVGVFKNVKTNYKYYKYL